MWKRITLSISFILLLWGVLFFFYNKEFWVQKIDSNHIWDYSFSKHDSSVVYTQHPSKNEWFSSKKDSTIDVNETTNKMDFFLQTTFHVDDVKKINAALITYNTKYSVKLFINDKECYTADSELISSETYSSKNGLLNEIDIYESWAAKKRFLKKEDFASLLRNGENTLTLMVYNLNKIKSLQLNKISFWVLENNAIRFPQFQNPEFMENRKSVLKESTVPILKINTHNQVIPDDPKITSSLSILEKNEKLNEYAVKIEKRGYTSQSFAKKSYGFTIYKNNKPKKEKLLKLPAAKKWILYGPYADKSLIRNTLTYSLYEKMGYYSPRSRCVELIINDNYQGLYWLMEKINIGKNHLNIQKLTIDSLGNATGGYLLEMGRFIWKSNYPLKGDTTSSIFYYDISSPNKDSLTAPVIYEIQNQLYLLEKSLYYQQDIFKHIDINSFIDFFIINEFTKNDDAYRMSTYFYNKDISSKNPKFFMGPVWDFNFAYGLTHVGSNPEGFVYNSSKHIPFWWKTLVNNPMFYKKLQSRYTALRKTTLSTQSINNTIDSLKQICKSPSERNFKKWNVLGSDDVWPNYYIGKTYEEEIDYLKLWINNRLIFLDGKLMIEE